VGGESVLTTAAATGGGAAPDTNGAELSTRRPSMTDTEPGKSSAQSKKKNRVALDKGKKNESGEKGKEGTS